MQQMGGAFGAGAAPPPGNPVQDMESFQKMHGLDNDALKKVYKQFLATDTDKSGLVDINEFCRLLRVERSPFVERLFGMFDTDKTGTIDLKEFVVGLSNVGTAAREDKVKFAFQVFDLDGSGTIDADELKKIVKATNGEREAARSQDRVAHEAVRHGRGREHLVRRVRQPGEKVPQHRVPGVLARERIRRPEQMRRPARSIVVTVPSAHGA